MSKNKKPVSKSRDAPKLDKSTTAWFCSPDAYNMFVTSGYTRLSQCPEVVMCVQKYADLISSMTIYLMQNTEEGDVRVRNDLARKVDIEPYRYMTRKNWMYNIVKTMMLDGEGNQVTYPHYKDGYLEDLEPLPPSKVTFIDTENGYQVMYAGKSLSPDEVLHFVNRPDPERPWIGTGYRTILKDITKGLKQAGATKNALMESPTPNIIIKVDGLTEEFSNVEGRRKLREQYIDDAENGLPWMIPAETFSVETVKPLTLNDLAIKQGMELDKRTVAGIFSMPPFIVGVGSYDKAEYNNFITSCIMPMAQSIAQELTRKLLYSPDFYWHFNVRSLYAYDLDEMIKAGSAMVDRMAMRRNEWRDWIGMEPDPDMDELLALENFIPADKLGDQKKLNGGGSDGGSAGTSGSGDADELSNE